MYLSDLRVYFKVEVGWRSAKIAEKLVDYGNTCVPENFIPWLIN